MGNEYFDISVINFEKYILHGRIKIGVDENGVAQEKDIEQVLTDEQKQKLFRNKIDRAKAELEARKDCPVATRSGLYANYWR